MYSKNDLIEALNKIDGNPLVFFNLNSLPAGNEYDMISISEAKAQMVSMLDSDGGEIDEIEGVVLSTDKV